MNIQWYPGHMAKSKRQMQEMLRLVDAVCEIADARIPVSSRNPELALLAANKKRMIVLNRSDQADPEMTGRWLAYFKSRGETCMEADSKSGKGVKRFPDAVLRLLSDRISAKEQKGQPGYTVRVMIAGIPNVGKSSFINRLTGRRSAKSEDRPGVTRGGQWIAVGRSLELLDTPGLLWPRLDGEHTGEYLAFTGAVRDDILDTEELAGRLMDLLAARYPEALSGRYRIDPLPGNGHALLAAAAKNRGFLLPGGVADTERMARILLDEFRGSRLGRITLEEPPAG